MDNIVRNAVGPAPTTTSTATLYVQSLGELVRRLWEAYNERQSPVDLEEIEHYHTDPEYVDARRELGSWRHLAKDAVALACRELTKSEWDESLMERTERVRDLHRVSNVEMSLGCATAVRCLGFEEDVEGEVFRRAKWTK